MISHSLAYCLNKAISAAINSGDISLAYPPYPSPSSLILTVKKVAPKDSTYSLTAGLVSKALKKKFYFIIIIFFNLKKLINKYYFII